MLGSTGVPERQGLTFTEELNGHGSIEFTLPIDHADVTTDNFAVGERELHLFRTPNGGVETLVWGGKLWIAEVNDWEVRFEGYGWLFDLERRYVNGDYAEVKDQFGISNDMIQYTQGRAGNPWSQPADADIGISIEAGSSGVTRKAVVCIEERQTIMDVIKDLSGALHGFDFEITPNKVFKNYYPFRTRATTVMFDGAENIFRYGLTKDATELTTDVWAVGEDEDCAIPTMYRTFDSDARTTFGLLEGQADFESGSRGKDKEQALLEEVANEQLRVGKDPRFQPEFIVPTPLQDDTTGIEFGDVIVGDAVSLQVTRGAETGFGHFSRAFRVVGRTVGVMPNGLEAISYQLDSTLPVIP